MDKEKVYYGVSAIIVFALIILQYILATETNSEGNTALLFLVTIIIVVYKIAEVLYLAIKTPVPPRPNKIVQNPEPARTQSDITIKTPIPQSPILMATEIKVPVPPRPKAMYYFTTGIFVVSVFILYFISMLQIEPGPVENLLRGLFIIALITHLFATAALFSKSNVLIAYSQEIEMPNTVI